MLSASRVAVNTNFKVIGLTRLVIKPESTAPEADAFTTRPLEQTNNVPTKILSNAERSDQPLFIKPQHNSLFLAKRGFQDVSYSKRIDSIKIE